MVHSRHRKGLCLFSDSNRFIYILIPKCASSALRRYLVESYGCTYGYYQELDQIRRNYAAFTFFRDPVDRFISAYLEITHLAWPDQQDKAFYAIPPGPEISDRDKARRFSLFVQDAERHKWDEHLIDQFRFIGDIPAKWIGTVENLDRDMTRIFQNLGLVYPWDLPHLNVSSDNSAVRILPEDINDNTLARVRRIYMEDMEIHSRALTCLDPLKNMPSGKHHFPGSG